MKEFLMIALGALIFVVIFQIAKASEYVSVLKGEDNTRKQNNKINAPNAIIKNSFINVLFVAPNP